LLWASIEEDLVPLGDGVVRVLERDDGQDRPEDLLARDSQGVRDAVNTVSGTK
jgi:hypothetical protein